MAGNKTKYILVTGGVCSGLGKGISTASMGAILKAAGFKVFILKIDPYLNVDPGTMNPLQHGEVFVTDDGYEADLDLGHYERFIDENLSKLSNVTTGQIFQKVIKKERQGSFLGKTIQIIPHITTAVKDYIEEAARRSQADVLLIEIGGTIGDIEADPFLEAARQFHREKGHDSVMFVHVTLLPYLKTSKELKTKPTQQSVRELHRRGIQPDIIIARSDYRVSRDLLEKIALFTDVPLKSVIPALTVKTIYEVPLSFEKYGISETIFKHLSLKSKKPNLKPWQDLLANIKNGERKTLTIAMVGKYTAHGDAYISVNEALKSATAHYQVGVKIIAIDSEKLEKKERTEWNKLKKVDGLVVPGGFGTRGIEGKIAAAKFARTNQVPYLGLCLGMQIMTIEFARFVLGSKEVSSTEFSPKIKHPVIHIMPEQRKNMRAKHYGASMRLGAYACTLTKDTKAFKAYAEDRELLRRLIGSKLTVRERHRHRYEVNNDYRGRLERSGLVFSGVNEDKNLVEIVELKDHPFMLGTQFHPEFKSRPLRPHPLFRDFIKACLEKK